MGSFSGVFTGSDRTSSAMIDNEKNYPKHLLVESVFKDTNLLVKFIFTIDDDDDAGSNYSVITDIDM